MDLDRRTLDVMAILAFLVLGIFVTVSSLRFCLARPVFRVRGQRQTAGRRHLALFKRDTNNQPDGGQDEAT